MIRIGRPVVLLSAVLAVVTFSTLNNPQASRCLLADENGQPGRTVQGGNTVTSKSTGMKLALIRAGAFEMGSLSSEDGHSKNEDQHTVRISRPFYLGVYEVTQGEFASVMETNPSAFARTGSASTKVDGADTTRFPVETVSWFDAIEFCNTLSEKDGLKPYYGLTGISRAGGSIKSAVVTEIGGDGYRLPTEAEWEYACRAGTATAYDTGETVASLAEAGWYGGQKAPAGNSGQQPHRVGQKTANAFGLFDMHGNVSEWCQDWYDYNWYDRSPSGDPTGPPGGSFRMMRGGSWNDTAVKCRSAHRDAHPPLRLGSDTGFRVARSLPAAPPQKTARAFPPYRIVIELRNGGTVDVYKNETYDSLDSAKQRLRDSKLYGRINTIRIIDGNGNPVD